MSRLERRVCLAAIFLPVLISSAASVSSGNRQIVLVDHGLTTGIDPVTRRPLDYTSCFDEQGYVFSWIRLNTSWYGVRINWLWYDPRGVLVREFEQLEVGSVVFAFSSMPLAKEKIGSWRVDIYTAQVNDNRIAIEEKTLICSDRFFVGTGTATVKISGLPMSTSAHVYLDGNLIGTVAAEEQIIIRLGLNSSHDLSIDQHVYSEPGTRYLCSRNVLSIIPFGTYTFNYTVQYYVSVASKQPALETSGWYNRGDRVTASVKSPIVEEAGVRHAFIQWKGLPGSSSSSNLSIIVDRPLNITAVWKTQFFLSVSSSFGTPKGEGWYDEGTVAKFSVAQDMAETVLHHFEHWEGDYSADSTEGSLLMDGPKKVTAQWTTSYWPLIALFALTACAGVPLASEKTRRSSFAATSPFFLGCAGWLALTVLLGPGQLTLVSFSVFLLAAAFGTSFFFPMDTKQPLLVLVLVTSALLVQELLLTSEYSYYGFLLSLAATVAFPLTGGLLHKNKPLSYVLQASGLIFASRVAYVPFPGRFLNIAVGLPSLYLLIFLMCLLFILIKKIDLKELGLQVGRMPLSTQILAGLSIGVWSGLIEYSVLKPPPISSITNPLYSILYILFLMMVLVGISEEILFRSLVQGSMSQVLPPMVAIQVASLQFGFMHLGWRNPIEILFAYAMGLVMGFMFWKTESLIAPVLLHGVGNVVMFLLAATSDIPITLTYVLIGGSAASIAAAFYLLKKHMPLDDWSASMEIRRRREKLRRLTVENG